MVPPPAPPPFKPRKASTQSATFSHGPKLDPFYGHEDVAHLCSRFISHLFQVACPTRTSSRNPLHKLPPFGHFIAYALHRTKLHPSVTFGALLLLQRLKDRFPTARASYDSQHRLFISAYMLSSKIICDDTYSNKSWAVVAQNLFTLREINQMERELAGYLSYDFSMAKDAISNLEAKIRHDFHGPGPYPSYSPEQAKEVTTASSTPKTPTPATGTVSETPPPPIPPSFGPPSSHPLPSINPLEIVRNAQSWNLNDSVLSNVGRDQVNNNQGIVIQNLTVVYRGTAPTPPKREIVKGQSVLGIWTTIHLKTGNIRDGQSCILPEIRPIAPPRKLAPLSRQTH